MGKYLKTGSVYCGKCTSMLWPRSVVANKRHIYTHGQLWSCPCGQSKLWTNSVRSDRRFIDFVLGREKDYTAGFCNDMFCGICFHNYIHPVENGYRARWYPKRNFDRYGCFDEKKRKLSDHNQMICIDGFEGTNNDTWILNWWWERAIYLAKPEESSNPPKKVIACGLCYEWAFKNREKYPNAMLVHGIVHDPWDGHAYDHAWLESDGRVYDWQSTEMGFGRPHTILSFYDAYAPAQMTKYTPVEAFHTWTKFCHRYGCTYGPWNIKLLRQKEVNT